MRVSALMMSVGLVVVAACASDDASSCPDPALAGGDYNISDGTPGVYVVQAEQDGTILTAGFVIGVPEPTPAMAREDFAFIAPDRWLRLSTTFDGRLVQECRRGGTPGGACDELGPPNHGRLVVYRDGVQTVDMSLFAPAWPVEPVVAGCPTLFSGHVD